MNKDVKYKEVLVIESLSSEEIRKLNTTAKRCSTQLREITSNAQELLSQKDYNTLQNAEVILTKVIDKRTEFIKKSDKKTKKIQKLKKTLKSKIDKLDDIKKLTYILSVDIEAFKYFSPTFEEAYDDFLQLCAKKLERSNITISDLIEIIENSIKNNKSTQFHEEVQIRIKAFGLTREET